MANIDDFFNVDKDKEEIKEKKDLVVTNLTPEVIESEDLGKTILSLSQVNQYCCDMDALANSAIKAFDDIMEIAKNSEERNAAHILTAAIQAHKNALDAKESKAKIKLQTAQLLLRKEAQDSKKIPGDDAQDVDDVYLSGDRNKILDAIKDFEKKEKK